MPGMLVAAQRYVIATVVVLTCVLFTSSLADPVNIIKLTALVLGAITLVVLSGIRAVRLREAAVPVGAPAWVLLSLLVAFVASAVAAPTAASAVVGAYGRNSGLLAYVAAVIVFLVGLRVWSASSAHVLLLAFVLGGLFTASYGLLQYAGIDAIAWNNPFNPILASLGNPDFASAYLGICTPAAAWGAVWDRWALGWRIASGAVAVTCLATAALSSAIQGPLAAAAGLTIFFSAVFLERGGTTGRRGLISLGAIVGLGLAVLLAGVAKIGPATPFFSGYSWDARTWYWGAAFDLFQRNPLFGVGLDQYGTYWRQVRPDESTRIQGGEAFSDSAHSVPLQMLAQGGLLLALAYLLLTALVAWVLVRGLLRLDGQPRLLLGGLGGAWAAYVVQSIVSIDQIPLLTAHFTTASAILGVAGVAMRVVRLPGAQSAQPQRPGRRKAAPVIRQRALTGADLAAMTALSLVGLVAAWFALLPLRANAAVHDGDTALSTGDGNGALASFEKANRLMPGLGIYWGRTAGLYETVRRHEDALATYRRGVRHDPLDVPLLSNAGRLAAEQGDVAGARRYLAQAIELDPTNPATAQLFGSTELDHGDAGRARAALERAAVANNSNAELWAAVGRAHAKTQDLAAARMAYERALQLRPDLEAAKTGLAALPPAT